MGSLAASISDRGAVRLDVSATLTLRVTSDG